ncbi:MAG: hypothetical protein ABI647_11965 [Gemmatimonadota bacterium]
MLKQLAVSGFLTLVVLGGGTALAAQDRSAVSGSELETAVLARSAERGANEAVVQRFLQTDRVQSAAAGMGVKTTDLAARVGALDETTLSLLAERTRADERQLAGGSDTIVISSTVIIIALLIIILLVK